MKPHHILYGRYLGAISKQLLKNNYLKVTEIYCFLETWSKLDHDTCHQRCLKQCKHFDSYFGKNSLFLIFLKPIKNNIPFRKLSLYQVHKFAMNRSSRPEVFCNKDIFKNFSKFTGKHLCQSLFLNKVACARRNFAKFLRTSFSIEHLRWLPRNKIFCQRHVFDLLSKTKE